MEQKQNKRVKWDYDSCYAAAKQCNSITEFQRKFSGAYKVAHKNKWISNFIWFKSNVKPAGYWDYDRCYNAAKQCTSKIDFRKQFNVGYAIALKNNWLKDYTWFIRPKKEEKWSENTCYMVAKQCKSKKEFKEKFPSAYTRACKQKWIINYTWLEQRNIWTEKECYEAAKQCTSIAEFRNKFPAAYNKAQKNGWRSTYTWIKNKQKSSGYWDYEHCYEVAKECKTKKEFREKFPVAYNKAQKNDWLDDYTWLEKRIYPGYWDYEHCYIEAQKYKNRKDFANTSPGAYDIARKNNWLDDYTWFEIYSKPMGYWTEKRCYEAAKQYTSITEFRNKFPAAYNKARKNNWLDDYTWFEKVLFYKEDKLSLLSDNDLIDMSDHQLLELISVNALPNSFKVLARTEPGSEERKDTIKKLREKILGETEETEDEIEDRLNQEADEAVEQDMSTDNLINKETENKTLPELGEKTKKELDNYDKFITCYGEKYEFISRTSITKIWNTVLTLRSKSLQQADDFINSLTDKKTTAGEWYNHVLDRFLSEYNDVNNIIVPNGWAQVFQPELMQKLMAYRMLANESYGNWCGTGAGKTIAFILATRVVDARVTICVCPNSVTSTIQKEINNTYPDSNVIVYNSLSDIVTLDRSKFNYILINYEKFQQRNSAKLVNKLIETNQIDFICFDEVHKAKNEISTRCKNLINLRLLAHEHNSNLKVLGMTATPLINNIQEVRIILELITGKSFKELDKSDRNISNIHNAHKYLMLNGFRYIPDYKIGTNPEYPKTDGSDLTSMLIEYKNKDINNIEGLLIPKKFSVVLSDIKKYRTIIYTQYIKAIIPVIRKELDNAGFTYREYTGEMDSFERDSIVKKFANKEFDVILASSPISTGVDGLQKICDTIIIMSLPWTSAEYEQLVGRIKRKGSNFTSVNIIVPQVTITLDNGETWSWDSMRYNIIDKKHSLADAVVDGNFNSIYTLNRKKLLREAIQNLQNGISDIEYERPLLMVDLSNTISSKSYGYSVMNSIHQKANTSTSTHMHDYFIANPDKWREYHESREENKKDSSRWTKDPIDTIAEKLNRECCNLVIADIGCGTNMLKTKVKSYKKWYSVDHYSDDPTVIKADAANLKDYIEDNSVDCAVFCLSLWGVNYLDSIKEAYRYLKPGGKMYIVKPEDKVNQDKILQEVLGMGFRLDSYSNDVDNKPKCTYIYYSKI